MHALPNKGVSQLDGKQVVLGLFGAVLHRVKQLGVEPGDLGKHPGIEFIALAFVGVDGA